MDIGKMTLDELASKQGLSPFEANNDELAKDRFYGNIRFKSKEEEKYFYNLSDSIKGNEVKRLTIGMEKFGYDNKKKLSDLNKS